MSQLPPVRFWFKRAAVSLEVHHRLQVLHKIGNPNLGIYLSVSNIGGRQVRIQKISAAVSRDRKTLCSMSALTYFERISDPKHMSALFTPFTLKPGDDWGHFVSFLNPFDRSTEKAFRTNEKAIRDHITKARAKQPDLKEAIRAPKALVQPFLDMFQRMFIWEPGEYVLTLDVQTTPATANISKQYRFTLYESDAEDMRKQTADYEWGAGIYFDVESHAGVFVPVSQQS